MNLSRLLTLCEDYCAGLMPGSAQQIKLSIRYFGEFLSTTNLDPAKLSESDCCRFLEFLRKRKGVPDRSGRTEYSNTSCRLQMRNVRGVLKIAGVPHDTWRKAFRLCPPSYRPEKRETGRLKGEEIRALLKAAPNTVHGMRLQCFIALTCGAGLRRKEALALRCGDFYMVAEKAYVRLSYTKNKRIEEQAIAPELIEYVRQWVDRRYADFATQSSFLFAAYTKHTQLPLDKVWIKDNVNRELRQLSNAVLGYKISSHWGRASPITRLIEQGLDFNKVRKFSRHSSIHMVALYDKRYFDPENNPGHELDYQIFSKKHLSEG